MAQRPRGTASAPQVQLSFLFDAPTAKSTRPADPAPGQTGRRVVLAQGPLPYQLRRGRRRTIGFQIDDRGLTISAPRWVSVRDIESAILEKERWIVSRLDQWRQWRAKRQLPEVQFVEGGQLPYLGRTITLRLRADHGGVRLSDDGTELLLALPNDAEQVRVRDSVQVWLKGQAQRILGERLQALCERHGLQYRAWALSSARSQWGSCGADGRIRLNWRLIHYSLPHIDYVVAHELAHLKEMNHGPAFWEQVGRLLPGFEAARDHMRREDLANLPI